MLGTDFDLGPGEPEVSRVRGVPTQLCRSAACVSTPPKQMKEVAPPPVIRGRHLRPASRWVTLSRRRHLRAAAGSARCRESGLPTLSCASVTATGASNLSAADRARCNGGRSSGGHVGLGVEPCAQAGSRDDPRPAARPMAGKPLGRPTARPAGQRGTSSWRRMKRLASSMPGTGRRAGQRRWLRLAAPRRVGARSLLSAEACIRGRSPVGRSLALDAGAAFDGLRREVRRIGGRAEPA
jgi:hypothetical protein